MEVEKKNLKEILNGWGNYKFRENTLYLYDNAFLYDKKLLEVLKAHNIKIQLDLFT